MLIILALIDRLSIAHNGDAGNVLEYVSTIDGQTLTTSYSYDDANQLLSGTQGGVTWNYSYDANGSLIESAPAGENLAGASRYTYNTAGFLTAVENHDGAAWQNQAQMVYDGLGNAQRTGAGRLTEVTESKTTTYTYDDANRIASVNGVTYAWDDNGNMLSDGIKTYTYDGANRLTSINLGTDLTTYRYDGLGNRVFQTVNGVTTQYSIEMNSGLTQVLTDGTYTYFYGLSRLGQISPTSTEFFLGDAA